MKSQSKSVSRTALTFGRRQWRRSDGDADAGGGRNPSGAETSGTNTFLPSKRADRRRRECVPSDPSPKIRFRGIQLWLVGRGGGKKKPEFLYIHIRSWTVVGWRLANAISNPTRSPSVLGHPGRMRSGLVEAETDGVDDNRLGAPDRSFARRA